MDWLDKVPQHYRPRFERWLATNPDQASRDGIRRLVLAGKVAVALKTIEDARLMKLMTFIVKRIAKQFDEFVRNMRSERMFALIVQAVESGQYQLVEPIIEQQITRFANVIPEVFQHAGREMTGDYDALVKGLKPSVGVSFDPYNPRAAQAAQQQQYDLIRLLNQEQKEATRNAVISAVERGLPPRQTAREISRSIGLTPSQLEHVQNYRKALEDSSKSALNRALRDKRFDRSVERAADGDKPLSAEQIDKMVERYTERYIRYRSETIAITEGTEALSRANHEAMLQTIELADIDPEDVEKEWNSTQDGRTRPSHVFLNRKKVQGINALFTSGLGGKLLHPGDRKNGARAADIVRCRCICAYRIRLRGA